MIFFVLFPSGGYAFAFRAATRPSSSAFFACDADEATKTINLGVINICNDTDGKTLTYTYQYGFDLGEATYAGTVTTSGGVRYRYKTSSTSFYYDTITLEMYISDASAVSAGQKKIAFSSSSKQTSEGYKVYATLNIVDPPEYTGTTNVNF